MGGAGPLEPVDTTTYLEETLRWNLDLEWQSTLVAPDAALGRRIASGDLATR